MTDGIRFGVLGPVTAECEDGPLDLKGPRHRAVLARLIVARRRVVPVARLVADLWPQPPAGAVGALQTFVAALRRALEPDRPPRAPAHLLVTEGPGYALRAAPDAVDAWRFEKAVTEAVRLPPGQALDRLEQALTWWRGPAYAEFAHDDWARAERARLAELRLRAEEQRAATRLALGRSAEAVPDLEAHVTDHPWREEAWRLLALALYRTGRQGDALTVLRRARTTLVDQLGVDPGPALRRLEADVLAQDPALEAPEEAAGAASLWHRAAQAYDRTVAAGSRARLESTVGLLRGLALAGGGGLAAAREQRTAVVDAAEELGDPALTARVIGAYDVPAVWTRGDDPRAALRIVAAAERTLAALPPGPAHDADRCRLLATVALESRGTRSPRGPAAAAEAEALARRLDDPALLAFALNGRFMQSCARAGLAARRDAIGEELVTLSARHGLASYEVLGELVRMQARAGLGDRAGARAHAAAADRLGERHERPLVAVFTGWYRAMEAGDERAVRSAAALLDGAGMPGLAAGLLPLALLCLRLADRPRAAAEAAGAVDPGEDWGPYRPWMLPFALLGAGRRDDARTALGALPEPPADLLQEALCCLEAALALELGDRTALERTRTRLLPAAGEVAGAGSGLVALGPVDRWLAEITAASRTPVS
ncbi:BTAD domain-containing putative transcriptional regulator [Streptomyces sp. NPDC018610]|uniref:AfsR/SARP family transcriptional regulator n=1 Tax=Streptomyces sp. NPDC018610 TaxID=3365049 RepID=UPI003795DDEF